MSYSLLIRSVYILSETVRNTKVTVFDLIFFNVETHTSVSKSIFNIFAANPTIYILLQVENNYFAKSKTNLITDSVSVNDKGKIQQ